MNLKKGDEMMDESSEVEDKEMSEWEGFQRENLADTMLDMFEDNDTQNLD